MYIAYTHFGYIVIYVHLSDLLGRFLDIPALLASTEYKPQIKPAVP
jgi:hypothetical protein